nr:NUDIX domain-containing protein [Robiginitalea sp. SC105]
MKSEAHRQGLWHPTAHVWFYTDRGEILLQRRSETKATDPGLWDVSVAGHIDAGETIREGALREIREEIGLEVPPTALEAIGVFPSDRQHPGGICDREFNHVFLCRLNSPLNQLRPQEEEVAALRLMPYTRLAEEAWGLARPGSYVPHGPKYYGTIIREIKKRL